MAQRLRLTFLHSRNRSFSSLHSARSACAQLTLFGLSSAGVGGSGDADAAERDSVRAPVQVGERVWLPHKGGYAAARMLPNDSAPVDAATGEQKCRVRVEFSGEELVVNDLLEKVRLDSVTFRSTWLSHLDVVATRIVNLLALQKLLRCR